MVRLATRMPSFNNSPRIRSAPHVALLAAMWRMRSMTSAGRRGGGLLGWRDFQRQKRRNPSRCQCRIVSGFTSRTALRQLWTSRESRTRRPRSCGRKASALDLAGRDDQLLAEQGVLGDELLPQPGQVDSEPGYQRQRPCGLAQRRLGAAHRRGDGPSKAAEQERDHGADLAQARGNHQLAKSEIMNDPAAEERSGQHSNKTAQTSDWRH